MIFPIVDDLLLGKDIDPTVLHIGDRLYGQKWVMYSFSLLYMIAKK